MQVLSFVQDYWPLVIIGIIVVVLIRIFLKSLTKIAAFLLVIGLVLVYVFHYSPQQVINLGGQAAHVADDAFSSTVKPILESEAQDAKYSFNPDGSYTVQTKHLMIKGKKGDKNATVSYAGHDFTVNIDQLGGLIEQHIQAGQ